jgi:hypothetical protein
VFLTYRRATIPMPRNVQVTLRVANQLAARAYRLAFKVISSPAIHAGALGLPMSSSVSRSMPIVSCL